LSPNADAKDDETPARRTPRLSSVAGFLTWLRSTLRGEVSAAALVVRRGAGTAAYSLADEAGGADGDDRGTRLFKVCAWNAFALQTIADKMIETDAANDPATAGYVPESTLRYASECLDGVPDWIRLARVVQSDPDARVGNLPARLPQWRTSESTRLGELRALRAAYEALEARVASEIQALEAATAGNRGALTDIKRTRAEMESAADYAYAMSLPGVGPVDRGEARWRLLSALEKVFALGQLVALPTLAEVGATQADAAEPGFSRNDSWLRIEPGWPVFDREGTSLGLVLRVHGDRDVGAFEGIDIGSSLATATLTIGAASVSAIKAGEVRLSITRNELATS
jgi:hypothetical protein